MGAGRPQVGDQMTFRDNNGDKYLTFSFQPSKIKRDGAEESQIPERAGGLKKCECICH